MSDPTSEGAVHVAAWQASGLSQAAYCRQACLPYHRFRVMLERRPVPLAPSEGFVEVRRPTSSVEVILEWSGHTRLRFPISTDPAWVGQVIRSALAASC